MYQACLSALLNVAFSNLVLTSAIPLTLSVQYTSATSITNSVSISCTGTHLTNHSDSFLGSSFFGSSGVTGPSDVLMVPYGVGIISSLLTTDLAIVLPKFPVSLYAYASIVRNEMVS